MLKTHPPLCELRGLYETMGKREIPGSYAYKGDVQRTVKLELNKDNKIHAPLYSRTGKIL